MAVNLFDVQQEIVVVTGVSGQLGSEYAKALLNNGAIVVGLDMSLSDRSTNLIEFYQNRFHFFKSNITKKKELESLLLEIELKIGVPTVLINNAAIDSPPSAPPEENGPFENYPEASWDRVLEVNMKGVFLCCQIFGAAMAKAKKGSIINIASIYGVVSPDQNLYEYRRKRGEDFYKPVAYSASKSGILNLTRYLAVYWAKKNIRVNSLTIAGVYNNQEQEFLDVYCSRIPVGRMANVDEYNGSILFLSSNASKYMTGHNLVVDGGWTAI
jgi:NAD(P)-dependent dehydrogenase (short-subunit alcohol dehydrogenase family)